MLRLNNVSAGYGKVPVLRNVSLELKKNEVLAVIGLNGSGKSTLLRTMLGLLPATSGTVHWNSRPIGEMNASERARNVSLLDSRTEVHFAMTVAELMKIKPKGSEYNGTLAAEALTAVGLNGFENRNLLELSSGEAKRAFIAHTLSTGADVMLFDEPFAHLDWSHQVSLSKAIQQWRSRHDTTFVLAIHELERAVQISDRVAALHEGKLLCVGTAEKVFDASTVREVFAFQALIDQNPMDGSKRLTLGSK